MKKRGVHRKKRDLSPLCGMRLHQDGSRHEWVEGKQGDLMVTMDDATNEHDSMFFVEEEGTMSRFRGVQEVIENKGLFSSLYTDRGSHDWTTPAAGGKVDKVNLTQFGRAMKQLGMAMIAASSPEVRGRSERAFSTHQGRLPKELALQGIQTLGPANKSLKEVYQPAFNEEFTRPAREGGTAFVPWVGDHLEDVLCEQHERTVRGDHCVRFEGMSLQIPRNAYRCNDIRVQVRIHRYGDGSMALFHGPRKLAVYDPEGNCKTGANGRREAA